MEETRTTFFLFFEERRNEREMDGGKVYLPTFLLAVYEKCMHAWIWDSSM